MVSPGKNPLPAEVWIKRHPTKGNEFYNVDQWKWYSDRMPAKDYEDPVQIQFRKLLNRAMVNTFAMFEYTYDALIDKYFPRLPMPHDACIKKVITIVKRCQATCLMEMNTEITELQITNPTLAGTKHEIVDKFNHTCSCILCGYIARLLLNAISTYQVGKNWNSHGATLGATLCQMASMLSHLDNASRGSLIDVDFTESIPQGNVQTGHKHGHHDVSYVEYMTSGKEMSVVTGAEELYLDHLKFRSDHHDAKVREIMDRELPEVKAPAPRPTWGHTFDFNLTYRGAHLLDGECKGDQSEHEKAILVFHSLDQLAFKDKALALLTTNNLFTFYSSWTVDGAACIQTCYHELKKFKLGPISKLDVDDDKDAEHLQTPPLFAINGNADFVENDKDVLKVWGELRSEVREFIGILMHAVDILCEAVCVMEIETVAENRNTSYTSGWVEPNFTSGDIRELKTRRLIEKQEEFIYCRKTMEGEDSSAHQERVNKQLYEGFKELLQSDVQMSEEMHAAVEYGCNHHKPPEVPDA